MSSFLTWEKYHDIILAISVIEFLDNPGSGRNWWNVYLNSLQPTNSKSCRKFYRTKTTSWSKHRYLKMESIDNTLILYEGESISQWFYEFYTFQRGKQHYSLIACCQIFSRIRHWKHKVLFFVVFESVGDLGNHYHASGSEVEWSQLGMRKLYTFTHCFVTVEETRAFHNTSEIE